MEQIETPVPSDKSAPRSSARRRILRGSLGAAPVALTLVSRPTPAAILTCLSASATISANPSGRTGILSGPGCNGQGPTAWRTATVYPSGVTSATLFSSYFSLPSYTAGATFASVLAEADTLAGDEPSKLRRNLVAALLNVLDGRFAPTIVDQAKLVSIWGQLGVSTTATWQVDTAGHTWNAAQTNAMWFNTHLFVGAV